MIAQLLPDASGADYDRFVEAHPRATVYHHRAWGDVLREGFGFRVEYLTLQRDGAIVGALPVAAVSPIAGRGRLVSLPLSHRVPPLAESEEQAQALAGAAVSHGTARRCGTIELRGWDHGAPDARWTIDAPFVNTEMPLAPDAAQQHARLRKNARHQLGQGLKSGLVCRAGHGPSELDAFARLMGVTRRRKGSLTYPRRFYASLAARIFDRGYGRLDLAYSGDEPIAGMVTFCTGAQAIYGYSASLETPALRAQRPLNVLLWRGIEWAIARGARHFDFGTSLPGQDGLIFFKEGFGGETSPLRYASASADGRAPSRISQSGTTARVAGAVLRALPQPIFDRLTPHIMRRLA